MKVGHYYPHATGPHSGVTEGIASWTTALLDAGQDVVLLHDGAADTDRYGTAELRAVRHVGRGRPGRVPVGMAAAIRDLDVLVLHEAWFTANPVAALAAKRAGVPYVVVPHGVFEPTWVSYLKQPRALRQAVERAVLRGAAAAHVWFPQEAEHVRRIEPSVRCLLAPPGFDVPAEQWRPGGDYLAWYGRYAVTNKGLDVLLRALAAIPASLRPPLRLHGVDYEGGFARTKALVSDLGLTRWVDVGGPIRGEDKLDFVLNSAGFVHPSRWDCIPIAVAENLALGVPCLVSDAINLAPDLAAEGAATVSGLGIAEFSAALASFPERGPAHANAGRRFVAKRLSWAEIMPSYVRQLTDVVSGGRAH